MVDDLSLPFEAEVREQAAREAAVTKLLASQCDPRALAGMVVDYALRLRKSEQERSRVSSEMGWMQSPDRMGR